MSTKRGQAAVALTLLGALAQAVHADGVFMQDVRTAHLMQERATIYEPEQKAAVLFSGGVEDLIISPRFSGPASRFAWVIPVPARPKVRSVDGALFHELAALTYVPPMPRGGKMGAPGVAKAMGVRVVERKAVGAYDVAVLKAGDAGALMQWLKSNGFVMPSAARGPVAQYVREKWTFVAARVRVPEAERSLHEGTLAPIRLTFRTARPIYPMRVSSASAAPFLVELYLILPVGSTPRPVALTFTVAEEGPGIAVARAGTVSATYEPDRRLLDRRGMPERMPTLASLVKGRSAIAVVRRRYRPQDCTRDIAWQVPTWAGPQKGARLTPALPSRRDSGRPARPAGLQRAG